MVSLGGVLISLTYIIAVFINYTQWHTREAHIMFTWSDSGSLFSDIKVFIKNMLTNQLSESIRNYMMLK